MTPSQRILFNLIVNSACSFLAGSLAVFLALKLFRVQTGRWKLYLLSLPFVKILWDIFSGIPRTSYLHTSIDPLQVPPKHTLLTIGAGFSEYGPNFNIVYSIKDKLGAEYSISFADYLYEWLRAQFCPSTPKILMLAIMSASGVLLLRRFWQGIRFEFARRRDRASAAAKTLDRHSCGGRSVDVYLSPRFEGTPFTGGVLRPYVCIPEGTYGRLNPEERHAVIQHELAHIGSGDLPLSLAIQVLGDLFWFVPGYRLLSRKIDRLREVLADRAAVARGASAEDLASALLKLKTQATASRGAILYSAFIREKSLLKLRVKSLMGESIDPRRPRWGWNNRWARMLILAWTTGGVMFCTIGGNHEVKKLPEWVERLARAWGWM